jgi:ubiquitin C-terminal hydrolase
MKIRVENFTRKFINMTKYMSNTKWTITIYSTNNIVIKPFSEYKHQFALCESCFWSATVFNNNPIEQSPINEDSILQKCPLCEKTSVSLMPLEKDEGYRILIGDQRGLEMQFSKC